MVMPIVKRADVDWGNQDNQGIQVKKYTVAKNQIERLHCVYMRHFREKCGQEKSRINNLNKFDLCCTYCDLSPNTTKKVTLALTILNENSIVPLRITKVHPNRGNFNYIWESPPVEEHPPNLIENFDLKQILVDSRDQTPDLNHSLQLNHLARGFLP